MESRTAEEKRTRDLRDRLRRLRGLESEILGAVREGRHDPGATYVYNACGDPHGCGCGRTTLAELNRAVVELKGELASRGHLPDKRERRASRQKAAAYARSGRGGRRWPSR